MLASISKRTYFAFGKDIVYKSTTEQAASLSNETTGQEDRDYIVSPRHGWIDASPLQYKIMVNDRRVQVRFSRGL